MTKEEVELKANILAETHKVKVKAILITDDNGEKYAAFVKHPTFNQMCYVFDKIVAGSTTDGAVAVFDLGLIREESNERFYSGKEEDAQIRLSGVIDCIEFVKVFHNEMKKK